MHSLDSDLDSKGIYFKVKFAVLFAKIYEERKVPAQWLVSKTIPVYKNNGDKNDIGSYRAISNLCSSSKIFEKLILKRILEIQEEVL